MGVFQLLMPNVGAFARCLVCLVLCLEVLASPASADGDDSPWVSTRLDLDVGDSFVMTATTRKQHWRAEGLLSTLIITSRERYEVLARTPDGYRFGVNVLDVDTYHRTLGVEELMTDPEMELMMGLMAKHEQLHPYVVETNAKGLPVRYVDWRQRARRINRAVLEEMPDTVSQSTRDILTKTWAEQLAASDRAALREMGRGMIIWAGQHNNRLRLGPAWRSRLMPGRKDFSIRQQEVTRHGNKVVWRYLDQLAWDRPGDAKKKAAKKKPSPAGAKRRERKRKFEAPVADPGTALRDHP